MYALALAPSAAIEEIVREKAIVDLVNGLEVVDDHIRLRAPPRGILARTWDGLTGASARRQQNIDRNMAAGLRAASEWLTALQAAQLQSDLALGRVVDRLLETRRGVMRLQERHEALAAEVSLLAERLDAWRNAGTREIENINARLTLVEARDSAGRHLDVELSCWGQAEWRSVPPAVRLVTLMSRLYWGPYGRFLRGWPEDEAASMLRALLRNRVRDLLVEDFGSAGMLDYDALVAPILDLPKETREGFAFLLDWSAPASSPRLFVIQQAADGHAPDVTRRLHAPTLLPLQSCEILSRRLEAEGHAIFVRSRHAKHHAVE
jgi:hypothetical protein